MYPFLRIGPLLINFSGLVILIGIWIGITLVEKESLRMKLNPAQVSNGILIGLVAGVVGARLSHALQYLQAYISNPLGLLSLNPDAFLPWAGLLIGVLATLFYGKRKGLLLRPTLDALAAGLAFFMISLGVSHFLSGNAYGAPADLPWSINLWSEQRHPTQVYEILAASLIFLMAWFNKTRNQGRGMNFLLVLAASACARIFLEAFRGDSLLLPGGFRSAQVAGLVVLSATLWLMRKWGEKDVPHGEQEPVENREEGK
ncbi:MAG: prolipoprotein diacylglyceryl transferase family protein [Chloroflexota bacterium]